MQDAFLKLWERWDRIDTIEDPQGVPLPRRAERLEDAGARRPSSREASGSDRCRPRPVRRCRHPRRRSSDAPDRSRRGNGPPSFCSTCTATDPRTPHGSWASVRRPSARSRRRAVPHSEMQEAPMAELKEIFEMVTNKTEPDLDAWQQQEQAPTASGASAGARRPSRSPRSSWRSAIVAVAVLRGTPVRRSPAALHSTAARQHDGLVAYDPVAPAYRHPSSRRRRGPSRLRRRTAHDRVPSNVTDGHPADLRRRQHRRHARRAGDRTCPGSRDAAAVRSSPTWSPTGPTIVVLGHRPNRAIRGLYVLRHRRRHVRLGDPTRSARLGDDPVVVAATAP